LSCVSIQRELEAEASKFASAPFFERIEDASRPQHDALATVGPQGAPFDFEKIDTFISYDSKDFSYAVRIYDALIDRAFNVFFAGASLPRTGTADFQLAIEQALANTRSMVLVATDAAHLEGGWVRAEWTTFLNEHRAGRKSEISLPSDQRGLRFLPSRPCCGCFSRRKFPSTGLWAQCGLIG
jgi:TIR domain